MTTNRTPTRLKVRLAVTGLAAIAGCVGGLILTRPVWAHTPSVLTSCHGISVRFTQYEGDVSNNHLTVTVDGSVIRSLDFADSTSGAWEWNPAGHAWAVDVDANINTGDPTQYDYHASGAQPSCLQTTTTTPTTAPTTTITAAPTTTVAAPTTTASPSTSTPGSAAPTSSVSPSTTLASDAPSATTAHVAVAPAPVPSAPVSGAELPATGGNHNGTLTVAGFILALGFLFVLAGWRRSRPN